MISAATFPVQSSPETTLLPTKPTCVKALAESPGLISIPPSYMYSRDPDESAASETEYSLPIIDFSLLTSGDPNQRSQVVQDLGKACREWGFFEVVNHGVRGRLMEAMVDAIDRFFNLREEEKQEFEEKGVLAPIRCGTSFNRKAEKVFFWRDFLKVFVHPEFHSPNKPTGFSEISREYSKQTRKVARELLKGISESLGLEECYIENAMDFESGFQMLAGNLYPPCPQPELAMGMPPHSDFGLLTLLIQNENGGLQLQHNGQWVNVDAQPNSFLVNISDHLEMGCRNFSNMEDEEKLVFEENHLLDPIRCGTCPKPKGEKVFTWRDYLKMTVHPGFTFRKNLQVSDLAKGYCVKTQKVAMELLRHVEKLRIGRILYSEGNGFRIRLGDHLEVVNHGMLERLTEAVIDALGRFFNMREEEKQEFEGKSFLDPITCETSFNTKAERVFFWRDFLKVCVHPEFHSPNKPTGFRE